MKKLCLLTLILWCSCSTRTGKNLEEILSIAGNNREQLEYVLNHYSTNSKDSLKFKAARYLIENMKYHYTYVWDESSSKKLKVLELALDSLSKVSSGKRDSVYFKLLDFYKSTQPDKIEDAKIIKAEYLIENIDLSFKVWRSQDWARYLSFDDFCEYILPYKIIDGPPLDDWKEYFYVKYNHLLTNLKYSSIYSKMSYVACQAINVELNKQLHPVVLPLPFLSIISLKTLSILPYGPCDAFSVIAVAVTRANGLPTGMDFTPQWPFRSMGHSWNILLENTKKNLVFESASPILGAPHKKDHFMGKVYRNTYKINKKLDQLIHDSHDAVPPVFSVPYIEDVTEEYMEPINLTLKVNSEDPYLYLSVFDNQNWEIIAWGKNNNGKVTFLNIGRDIVYLPVQYDSNGEKAVSDPILVSPNGQVQRLAPDTTHRQKLTLRRKYPLFGDAFTMNLRKIGAKIEGANRKDFGDAEVFHVFDNLDNDIEINPKNKKYRYWRFVSCPGNYVNVAELRFLDSNNQSIKGKIIGTVDSIGGFGGGPKEASFDGALLTFFDAADSTGGWVGMDFQSPTNIRRVTCIMRGDGNDIEIGDEYELFYWYDRHWISVGSKVANDIFIEFENCPTNALFLLHDKTKGIEERIFTFQNKKQVWW